MEEEKKMLSVEDDDIEIVAIVTLPKVNMEQQSLDRSEACA